MDNEMYQWTYVVEGLLPEAIKLKRKIWLKKGEVLLEKKDEKLFVYILGGRHGSIECGELLEKYLQFSALVSSNHTSIKPGPGQELIEGEKMGKKMFFTLRLKEFLQDDAIEAIEPYAPKFIRFIGNLHDRYVEVVAENDFLAISLDYFYQSRSGSMYSDSALIGSVVSLEALFNEGPNDIKYKLALRASALLGMLGSDPIELFEQLQNIYKVRSNLVHGVGGSVPSELVSDLPNINRRVISVFLILLSNEERRAIGKKKRKKALMQEIDYALLNKEKYMNLKREIKKGKKNFNLNIPRNFELESGTVIPW